MKVSRAFWARFLRWLPRGSVSVAASLTAALVLFVNDQWVFESVKVPSSSMRPTLLPDEWGWLQKIGVGNWRRGEVVVAWNEGLNERIVKRIVALPGERVRLEDSFRVVINGQPLAYEAVAGQTNLMWEHCGTHHHQIQLQRNPKFFYETKFGREDLLLGPDEFFLLGDNRLASGDSRDFGPVKRADLQGRMTRLWYSFDPDTGHIRWNRIGKTVHN